MEEILQKILGKLETLEAGQEELRTGQKELRSSVDELRTGQEELRSSVNELHTGQEELRSSVDELRSGQEELRTGLEDLRFSVVRLENKYDEQIKALHDARTVAQDNFEVMKGYQIKNEERFQRIEHSISAIERRQKEQDRDILLLKE
jgi:chromosome segregation ATPase